LFNIDFRLVDCIRGTTFFSTQNIDITLIWLETRISGDSKTGLRILKTHLKANIFAVEIDTASHFMSHFTWAEHLDNI